jgi:DNA-directed RNA polymerase subunit RPC12/RpoP
MKFLNYIKSYIVNLYKVLTSRSVCILKCSNCGSTNIELIHDSVLWLALNTAIEDEQTQEVEYTVKCLKCGSKAYIVERW